MSQKTDRFGQKRHPGECYRGFKEMVLAGWLRRSPSKAWKAAQRAFKQRKRLRKISRLARKGKRPRRTMRPVVW